MPDPDTLTHADAACWAATCRAVARAIRHELPYAEPDAHSVSGGDGR